MNELERTKAALGFLLDKIDRSINERMAIPDRALVGLAQQAREILNPPPVYEEVEITRWECDACGHVHKSPKAPAICNGAMGDGWCNGKDCFTLLSGTRKVEKPQPMERSVSVEAKLYGSGGAVEETLTDAVFGQFKEAHGKRGVLTFTWQE